MLDLSRGINQPASRLPLSTQVDDCIQFEQWSFSFPNLPNCNLNRFPDSRPQDFGAGWEGEGDDSKSSVSTSGLHNG